MILTLNNFQCYESLTLNFTDGKICTIHGPNGIGKSTVFQAIEWVLFGKMKDVSPWVNPKIKTVVQLELKPHITITRSRNPIVLLVYYQNREYVRDEAQSIINFIFQELDLWKASSYVAQDGINSFLMATPKEKLSILNRCAFGDETSTKAYIRRIEEEINKIKIELKSKIAFYTENANRFNKYLEQEGIKLGNSTPTNEEIEQYKNKIASLEQQIASGYQKLSAYQIYEREKQQHQNSYEILLQQEAELSAKPPTWTGSRFTMVDGREFPSCLSCPLEERESQIFSDLEQLDSWNKQLQLHLVYEKQNAQFQSSLTSLRNNIPNWEQYQQLTTDWLQEYQKESLEELSSHFFQLEQARNNLVRICTRENIECSAEALESARTTSLKIIEQSAQIESGDKLRQKRQQLQREIDSLRKQPVVTAPTLQKFANTEPLMLPIFSPTIEVGSPPKQVKIVTEADVYEAKQRLQICTQKCSQLHCPKCAAELLLVDGVLQPYSQQDQQNLIAAQQYLDQVIQENLQYSQYQTELAQYEKNSNLYQQEKLRFENSIAQMKAEYEKKIRNIQYQEQMAQQKYNHQMTLHLASVERSRQIEKYLAEYESIPNPEQTITMAELNFHRKRYQELSNLSYVAPPPVSSTTINNWQRYLSLQEEYNQWKKTVVCPESVPEFCRNISLDSLARSLRQYSIDIVLYLEKQKSLAQKKSEITSALENLTPVPNPSTEIDYAVQQKKELEEILRKKYLEQRLGSEKDSLMKLYHELGSLEARNLQLHKLKQVALEVECQLLEEIIRSINDYLAANIQILYSEPIKVTLSLIREIKSTKEVKSEVNLEISHRGGIFSKYDKLSGGEKHKLSLLFTLALNSLTNNPFLLLDEKFHSFDKGAIEEIIDILRECVPYKTIICINHSRLDDNYDQIINMEKYGTRF